jgi:hypothetical protein
MLCTLQATFNPLLGLREAAIDLKHTALLFIDCQNFNCSPDGALYGSAAKVSSVKVAAICTVAWKDKESGVYREGVDCRDCVGGGGVPLSYYHG